MHIGHDGRTSSAVDAVTASTAISADLNELDEARKLGVTVLRRAGMLASICAQAKSLAVAGTHGKTTTTSMLMLILAEAGCGRASSIGGDVTDMGTGAQWTGGEWFVVEADESDGTHLELPLHGTILTNIDVDHLDHYGSIDEIEQSFDRYLGQIAGPKVVCADDAGRAGSAAARSVTYGLSEGADVGAVDVAPIDGSFTFDVDAAADGLALGAPAAARRSQRRQRDRRARDGARARRRPDVAPTRSAEFGGVARRFDVRGIDGGATFVDDYAHLPTEIDAVLARPADSGDGWRRVIAVFQPNRFNRIAEMWRTTPTRSARRRRRAHRHLPVGTHPIPGSPASSSSTPCSTRTRQRVVWLPRRDDLVDFVAARRATATCDLDGLRRHRVVPAEVLDARAAGRVTPGPPVERRRLADRARRPPSATSRSAR